MRHGHDEYISTGCDEEWVEAQAEDGRYGNSSDVARDLIRREQVRTEKIAHMRRLIDEGLESGISPRPFDEILAAARTRTGSIPADDWLAYLG